MTIGTLIAVFVVLLLAGIICICTGSGKKGLICIGIALILLSRICKMFA